MNRIIIVLVIFLNCSLSWSQKANYSDYNWEKSPAKYIPTPEDLTKDELILFEKRSIEVFESNEEMWEYSLVHVIRLLNTDKAIERNNKVSISNDQGDVVLSQKVRVIKPNGTIIELSEADIKESKDEDGEVEERYFAIDGLEKGSIIEYLHYIKSYPTFSGAVIYLQGSIEKRRVELDIIVPLHLEYQFYPVNGMSILEKDSLATTFNRYFLNSENIMAQKDEEWAAYNANLKKCYYKLQKNTINNKANFYTYPNVTKNIHASIYEVQSKKTLKSLEKIMKEVTSESKGTESIIRNLEYKLKSEINVVESSFDQALNLDFVIENKITTESGITKLMAQLLKIAGIKHEIVLTINRNDAFFPTDYEAYNFLKEYLIYIPELDMYTGTDMFSRLGFATSELTNQNGLFIEERSMNEMFFPVAKVKEIKGTKGLHSVDEINTKVSFPSEMAEPKIEIERIVSGYKAINPQYYIDFIDEEAKKEAKEDFIKYVDKDATLENLVFENDNSKVAGQKPFIGRATFIGRNFIEQAGNKVLIKAGLLIGPQAALYNKEERILPVTSDHSRHYKRQIEIVIPDGYFIKNPEILNFNVVTTNKDDAGFISTYELKGNILIISIMEYYNRIAFPVSEYLEYEKVINSAADFNKIVLVMDKK